MADLRFLKTFPNLLYIIGSNGYRDNLLIPQQWIHVCENISMSWNEWIHSLAFQKQSLKAKAMYFIGRAAENTKTAKKVIHLD